MNFSYFPSENSVILKLDKNQVEIRYLPKKIHPDLIALCCLVCFPIPRKSQIMFPMCVSHPLGQILSERPFEYRVLNVDPDLERYYSGRKIGLTFSGGYDSLAIQVLFPGQLSVYQSRISKTLKNQAVINLGKEVVSDFRVVETSLERWEPWTAVLAPLILMASDMNLGYVGVGGNLGSVFLRSGLGYHPSHLSPSLWYRIFIVVGLPIFCPLAGVSDVGVVEILRKSRLEWLGKAVYCSKNVSRNCGICDKCYRRKKITERVLNSVSKSSFVHEDSHDSRTPIGQITPIGPLGPSLDWAITGKSGWNLFRYYSAGIEFQPTELKKIVQDRLETFLVKMDPVDERSLENFIS